MADLGNLYFDILLRDMTDADIDKIKKKLEKVGVKIGVDANRATLAKNIREALKNRTFKIDVEPNKKIKKASVEVNKSMLTKSVTDALNSKTFKANVDLVVKEASVQAAIKQAFAKAGMNYNTTASDVRAARVAEIQQRMAMRAANANRNLANSYSQAAGGADQFARASATLSGGLHTNIRLGGQLGTTLGNLASIIGLKDVLQDIVSIGGQLENQRIALGSILQDGGKATAMFSKIQSLAVKSPFGIMDLNQYVKQLSAYQVPYNELYDTMKRLADISAGVGVDMGRIILAFGQVKAAGFLKGTELRQFTEANIPMVQALADRFTELRGEIVSAAEVYDMISKKKVTFEDVKSVLWDLTDEGGMFNNMQEVLSESLASKWKNLADAVDVMFGKIADGWVGSGLKSMAEGLTELTKGWQYVATAIGAATLSFAAYKTSVAIGTKQMAAARGTYSNLLANKQQEAAYLKQEAVYRKLNKAELELIKTSNQLTRADIKKAATTGQLNKAEALRLITLGKLNKEMLKGSQALLGITNKEIAAAQGASRLKIAWLQLGNGARALGAALKSLFLNPWTIGFTVFTAIMEGITFLVSKSNELKDITKEAEESAVGSMQTIGKELDKLKDINIGELDDTAIKIQIKNLATLIQNEAPYWQGILAEVFKQDADGNFVKTDKEQLEELIKKINEVQKAKQMLAENSDVVSGIIDESWSYSQWDNFGGFMRDFEKSVINAEKKLDGLTKYYSIVDGIIHSIVEGNEELSEKLSGKSIQQQVLILEKYPQIFSLFKENLKNSPDIAHIIKTYEDAIKYAYEDKGDWGRIFDTLGVAKDNIWSQLTKYGYKEGQVLDETARQIVMDAGNRLETYAKVSHSRVLNKFWETFLKPFGLSRQDFEVPKDITNLGGDTNDDNGGSGKDAVAEMWKKRVDEIEKAVAAYDKWKKIEGALNAENRVKGEKEFANLFNGAYGFNLMLENPTSAYEYVQSQLNEKLEKQRELYVSLGVKISDAEFKDAEDRLKAYLDETKKFIDKTTNQWNLYKDLFKATGDKTVSMNIAFGGNVGFKDQLEQIKSEILKQMKVLGKSIGFDELIQMDSVSLEKGGFASLSNLIDAYNKGNKKLKDESIKNFIDIINASKDFEQKIADIERKLQKDLEDLRSNATGMPRNELKRREDELVKRAEEEKTKIRFEEFKESSDWVKVFDDLDRVSDDTLDNMTRKIEEFAKQAHLSEEVTKQLVEAMAKLREETIERNPLEGFKDAWNRRKYYQSLKGRVGEYDEDGKLITQKMIDDGLAEANEDLEKSSLAVAKKFQAVADAADLLTGLFENMGVNMDGFLGAISDVIGGAASGAQTGAGIAQAFGAAGPWGAVAGAAVGMLSSVFAMHDKALQKEIEASEAREELIKSLAEDLEESLERQLGGVYKISIDKDTRNILRDFTTRLDNTSWESFWGGEKYYSEQTRKKAHEALSENSYYDAQLAMLMAERDEIEHQMQLEEDKKKTNKEKIADYEQSIKDLNAQIDYFAEDMAKTLYDIDFKDWANQLADSMVNAWATGEDAAEAYKNKVSEILKDLGVSIITQKILEPALEGIMTEFMNYFKANNGKLDQQGIDILAKMYDEADGLAKMTEAYLDGLEKLAEERGESLKGDSSSSSLSKTVQGVTENTADQLASYLNGIRADVSVKRSLIEKLIADDIPQMSVIAQAQLTQLNNIAANTLRNADAADRIYDLFNRVVDKGGNKLKI